jgi:pyruvate dehydrogenase E2 component (dihydrolipoamide acetyltransferase)
LRLMRVPILMPKLGYDMTNGVIASWLAEIGDQVARGQPIAEIETDKIVVEMEALATGTLVEIVRDADASVVEVGEVIGYIDDES